MIFLRTFQIVILCSFLAGGVVISSEEVDENSEEAVNNEKDMLSRQLTNLTLTNASMHDAVRKLRKRGVRICLERTEEEDTDEKATDYPISLEFQEKKVNQILDEIVRQHPDYVWEEIEDIITIRPKTTSRLSWRISELKIEEQTLRDILLNEDMLQFEENDIVIWRRGPTYFFDQEDLVSFDLENKSAIEALNAVVAEHPFLCWTFWISSGGTGNIIYHFVIPPLERKEIIRSRTRGE